MRRANLKRAHQAGPGHVGPASQHQRGASAKDGRGAFCRTGSGGGARALCGGLDSGGETAEGGKRVGSGVGAGWGRGD